MVAALPPPACADKVHVWCKEGPDGERTERIGAIEELTLILALSPTLTLTRTRTRT